MDATPSAPESPFVQGRVRTISFLRKKEGITREEFSRIWIEHGKLYTSCEVVKRNILKYEQMHFNEELSELLTITQSDWDGIVIQEAESWEKFKEVHGDAEVHNVVFPDEKRFLDRSLMVTWPPKVLTMVDRK